MCMEYIHIYIPWSKKTHTRAPGRSLRVTEVTVLKRKTFYLPLFFQKSSLVFITAPPPVVVVVVIVVVVLVCVSLSLSLSILFSVEIIAIDNQPPIYISKSKNPFFFSSSQRIFRLYFFLFTDNIHPS